MDRAYWTGTGRADVPGEGARRAVLAHRGGGQLQDAGQVEVGVVGGHGGGVAGEQLGQRAVGRPQGGRESGVALGGVQGCAEDAEHRAGGRVEHRSPGRAAAEPQRVPAGRADGQLQGVLEVVEAVRGGVCHPGGGQDPCLAPAAGGDPDVGAGPDVFPDGQRKGVHPQALGADQGQVERGERDDGVGADHAGPVPRGPQDQAGQAVDDLVAGEEGALVVGEEPDPAETAGQVVDLDEDVCASGPAGAVRVVRAVAVPVRRPGSLPVLLPGPAEDAGTDLVAAPTRHGRTSPPVHPCPCSRR